MKKILLIMLFCSISIYSKAQETNSLQSKTTINIEELAAKLDKLQRDYDYLSLQYKINFDIQFIERIESQTESGSSELKIIFHHPDEHKFSQSQYLVYLNLYEANLKGVNSFSEETIPLLNQILEIETTKSRFSKEEITLLKSLYNYCCICCERAKLALATFKIYIDIYKRNIQ